jgi:uncharacterized protein (DUF2235 family)
MMAKNIIICCDGTGNDFHNPDTDSNVVKLYNTLHICPEQIAYYHPGVGTLGSPNANGRLAKWWSQMRGLAFGAGLLDNVGDAYRYLMNTYETGDHIYLFGFSRGSYTARAVGGLLHVFGLLEPGNEQLIPYILRLYSNMTKQAQGQTQTFPPEEAFKYAFSREVEVYFCGLWDTVSSYGWINSPIELPFNGQNPILRTGRHAVSIHEHRCCYQDNLWGPPLQASPGQPAQDLRQVWFTGVHSDIGGSYSENDAGLSKIAFEWILVEAVGNGLLVDGTRAQIVLGQTTPLIFLPKYVEPNPKGLLHISLRGAWWLLEYFPRKKGSRWCLPRGRWVREIPENSFIHGSVTLTGQSVKLPQAYAVEPWVRYTPPRPAAPSVADYYDAAFGTPATPVAPVSSVAPDLVRR